MEKPNLDRVVNYKNGEEVTWEHLWNSFVEINFLLEDLHCRLHIIEELVYNKQLVSIKQNETQPKP